ncbi:MAG TPA: PEPxxWA-CTERM sorting domain-containing protein [Phenylobacterium sp.]|jgi:hypothetical protein|nr:PEPxxWA-CTERM sorting domain-containing protein [Phenylobacterium sp.]
MNIVNLSALAAASLVFALAGSAAAAPSFMTTVSFTPIGDDPNIAWTGSINATVNSIDAGGMPDVLVSTTRTDGESVLDVPAILDVDGTFEGRLFGGGLDLELDLDYAGSAPLVVDGVTYNDGDVLDSIGFHLAPFTSTIPFHGGFGTQILSSNQFSFYDGDLTVTPAPTITDVSGRPSLTAGEGQLSGVWTFDGTPEPSAWALMILGFGLGGVSLRRRRLALAISGD